MNKTNKADILRDIIETVYKEGFMDGKNLINYISGMENPVWKNSDAFRDLEDLINVLGLKDV